MKFIHFCQMFQKLSPILNSINGSFFWRSLPFPASIDLKLSHAKKPRWCTRERDAQFGHGCLSAAGKPPLSASSVPHFPHDTRWVVLVLQGWYYKIVTATQPSLLSKSGGDLDQKVVPVLLY